MCVPVCALQGWDGTPLKATDVQKAGKRERGAQLESQGGGGRVFGACVGRRFSPGVLFHPRVSRGTDGFCYRLSFQGCLCSKLSYKIERAYLLPGKRADLFPLLLRKIMSPLGAKVGAGLLIAPFKRLGFPKCGVPWPAGHMLSS